MSVLAGLDQVEQLDADVKALLPEPDRRGRLSQDSPVDGPLSGVLVGIKDLYRVQGLETRAGSRLPAALFAGPESEVVRRLRASGAAILAKTAMDEFAYCEPPASRNPRDLRRTPGGSSGGSAAAVAAGLCPLALGSQTLQSIIVPASYCGVIGYKPTYDRVVFDGVPLAPSIDTIGFCADTTAMLERACQQVLPDWHSRHECALPVLGVPPPWGLRRLHAEGWEAFDRHVSTLRSAGYQVREARLPWNDDLNYWATTIGDLLNGEMARVHAPWYQPHKHLYRPRTQAAIECGIAISDDRLAECRRAREVLIADLHRTTRDAGIDCWICPATGTIAPLGYTKTGDSWLTSFWSYAGWPQLSLPVFDGTEGLPHGLQCITPAGTDETLLAIAATLQAPLIT